jgi:glycerophosphoryl diester phosphodiesterase
MELVSIPIIAHRTCPLHAPENSIAGIRMAEELGADGVEIDVRMTADGIPVLMHDRSPLRTTGLPGPVSMYPSSKLRDARLEGTSERVPTLEDALDALPDNLFLALEVKHASVIEVSLDLVKERGLAHKTLLWSYRESAIKHTAEHAPEIEASLLRDETDNEHVSAFLDDAASWGATGISAHWDIVDREFVGRADDRGLRVYSMTRDLRTVADKVRSGLAGIVTDHPNEVRDIMERSHARSEGLLLPA